MPLCGIALPLPPTAHGTRRAARLGALGGEKKNWNRTVRRQVSLDTRTARREQMTEEELAEEYRLQVRASFPLEGFPLAALGQAHLSAFPPQQEELARQAEEEVRALLAEEDEVAHPSAP